MTPTTIIPVQPWMSDPATRAVMAPLVMPEADIPVALFVGGCVRDAILGRAVVDVDIATSHPPDEVMRRLNEAGIGYHTIGVDHGTVGAHADGRTFEITTLRVDVETDGRHATVAYTDDWAADAARRDFTMNALYADLDGNVFDPLGGMDDLTARRVRFIGDPNERIREDALRILRFFRFHAQLEAAAMDAAGLEACRSNADALSRLSGERLRDELRKLLMSHQPAETVAVMVEHDVLAPVSEHLTAVARLAALVEVETAVGDCSFERRLFALLERHTGLEDICARLRLSKAEQGRMRHMAARNAVLVPTLSEPERLRELYRLGVAGWRDQVFLNWAESPDGPTGSLEDWRALLAFAETTPVPVLPVRGADVLDLGVPQGPDVSRVLEAVEAWWIEGGFEADRDACLAELARRAGA